VRISVTYNNVPHVAGLTTAWGFAAVVEAGPDTVLFDTGGDGPTLLTNLRRLAIDPASIHAVVLSHIHGDHIGGLDGFLERRSDVTVYMPASFPASRRDAVTRRGARVQTVGRTAQRLFANVHSTGEMNHGVTEQALIVETRVGLVVITGCAHPGIVDVAKVARTYLGKEIYLLMGGFHLAGRSDRDLRGTLHALRTLGVRKVAPSHCTGNEAITRFREIWGPDFIEGGCGAVIEIP